MQFIEWVSASVGAVQQEAGWRLTGIVKLFGRRFGKGGMPRTWFHNVFGQQHKPFFLSTPELDREHDCGCHQSKAIVCPKWSAHNLCLRLVLSRDKKGTLIEMETFSESVYNVDSLHSQLWASEEFGLLFGALLPLSFPFGSRHLSIGCHFFSCSGGWCSLISMGATALHSMAAFDGCHPIDAKRFDLLIFAAN